MPIVNVTTPLLDLRHVYPGAGRFSEVTVLENGNHLVVWEAYVDDTAMRDIHAAVYTPDGTVVVPPYTVNTTTDSIQSVADAIALPGGGYVIAWQSHGQDHYVPADDIPLGYSDSYARQYGVYLQVYDAAGQTIGEESLVNEGRVEGNQFVPELLAVDDGFIVFWVNEEWPTWDWTVSLFQRVYAGDGTPLTDPMPNPGNGEFVHRDGSHLVFPSHWREFVFLPDGNIAMAWTNPQLVEPRVTIMQPDGTLIRTFEIENLDRSISRAHIMAMSDGNLLVVMSGVFGGYIYGTIVTPDGDVMTEWRIQSGFLNDHFAHVDMLPDGNIIIIGDGQARILTPEGTALTETLDLVPGDLHQYSFEFSIMPDGQLRMGYFAQIEGALHGEHEYVVQYISFDLTQTDTGVSDGDDTLLGSDGSDDLSASQGDDLIAAGLGNDTLSGDAGDDTLYGDGGHDDLQGGHGRDYIYGGVGNDTLIGAAGNDQLYGDTGSDRLFGGEGNDTIIDTQGRDQIFGGDGDDVIRGNGLLDGGAGNDTITGAGRNYTAPDIITSVFGGDGDDLIDIIDTPAFVDAGAGDDTIHIYDQREIIDGGEGFDWLIFEVWIGTFGPEGARIIDLEAGSLLILTGNPSVPFEYTENTVSGIEAVYFPGYYLPSGCGFYGSERDEVVVYEGNLMSFVAEGRDGNDYFENLDEYPGGGSAHIDGGAGDDTILGGGGYDTFLGGDGDDLIRAGVRGDILHGGAGNDTIDGESGDDTIVGGSGNDLLSGGSGTDVFVFEAGWGHDTITDVTDVDLVEIDPSRWDAMILTEQDGDTLITFTDGPESILLRDIVVTEWPGVFTSPPVGIQVVGLDNSIEPIDLDIYPLRGTLVASLVGLDPDDDVVSMTLIDDLDGAYALDGFDLVVADGTRIIDEPHFSVRVPVRVTDSEGQSADFDVWIYLIDDWMYNGPVVIGTQGDDTLSGSRFIDPIFGLAGDDSITAGQADDRIDGGEGHDWIHAGGGDDSVLAGTGDDTIVAGNGDDTLRGEAGNDHIEAGRGEDSVSGDDGDDDIWGLGDNDTLEGGSGNDTLRGGRADDMIFAGDGDDSLVGQRNLDTLYAGAGDDTLKGGGGGDFMAGEAGDDFLKGGTYRDTLDGGTGNDTLIGNRHDDLLIGGDGDDKLLGGGHNDTLNGGSGNDTLRGGAGEDEFIFSTGHGVDVIEQFSFVDDRLSLSAALVGGLSTQEIVASATVSQLGLTLDFGNGNMIVLEGYTDASELAAAIDLF